MYIAMNRFKVKLGHEGTFEEVWRNRDSHLSEVPGFIRFQLLRGASAEEYTLFSSYAEWESEEAFKGWTQSEAFRKSHAKAGGAPRDIYAGPPHLECFEVVL